MKKVNEKICKNSKFNISLISLDDCLERRSHLVNNGFPKKYVENYHSAIDRRNSNIKELDTNNRLINFNFLYGHNPKCGEIGCLESHLDVYKSFLESSADFCLVLEDDNSISKGFDFNTALKMNDVANILQNKCHSFILNIGLPTNQIDLAIKQKVRIKDQKFPVSIYRVLDSELGIWRANAYIINRKAAENILQSSVSQYILADDWLRKKKMKLIDEIFVPSTPIFYQANVFNSTIQVGPPESKKELFINSSRNNLIRRMFNSIRYRFNKIYINLVAKFSY